MSLRHAFVLSGLATLGACATTGSQVLLNAQPVLTSTEVTRPVDDLREQARSLAKAWLCLQAKLVYADYAESVRESDPRRARGALSAAAQCVEDSQLRAVVDGILIHHDAHAVDIADHAAASGPTSPWMDYYRAVALAGMKRTDDAVAAFKRAEQRLIDDPRGRSIAIYGRARALDDANRCVAAIAAYKEYSAFVRAMDSKSAEIALRVAADCR